MNMAISEQMARHTCPQGSDEWHELRGRYRCASDAPVIMGAHPNMRRDELLEAKATYSPKEYSRYTVERIFPQGHDAEAHMRPLAEEMIGEELYPIIGTRGGYLASYDGLTMLDEISWENKQWNQHLPKHIEDGDLPPMIFWQLEHQLLVCPTIEKVLFTVGNGNPEQVAHMYYTAVPGRREQLIAGWEQFERDIEEFKPTMKTAAAVGEKPAELPVLFVDVVGTLSTTSNLADFKAGAARLISSIKTDLKTDADFADADCAVKFLDDAEKRIVLVKQQALSKTAQLSDLFTALDEVSASMKKTRLSLSKQVEAQKANRKTQIVADATVTLSKAVEQANNEFAQHRVVVRAERVDFYAVIKGKRSFDMMQSAVNDAIARAKIDLYAACDRVRGNLKTLLTQAPDHQFLFPDKQAMVDMEPALLALTIPAKIREFEDGEAQKRKAAAAKLEADEIERKRRHEQTVTMLQAASQIDDSLPYDALLSSRKRIEQTDTSGMQEFALRADQAKATAIAALTARINALQKKAADEAAERDAQAERDRLVRAAAVPVPMPTPAVARAPDPDPVFYAPITNGDDVGIHAGEVYDAEPATARPTDRQIIGVLTTHFRVHDSVIVGWLMGMDFEQVNNDLVRDF